MFTDLLIKNFIPDYQNTKDPTVRKRYGFLGGSVGILVNIALFVLKLSLGLIINSVALIADAFNNLSDVFSSVVTIWGFVLADKPADKEHPFGHGRYEYIAGLIVSFIIIIIGYEFLKSSFSRILHPVPLSFSLNALLLIIIAILMKGWLAFFNRKLAQRISSQTLSAASFDSISDVISSSCVLLALVVSPWTNLPVDGYVGLVVAGIIIFTGITQSKETISPLLGEASHEDLARMITAKVRSYEGIENIHDLIIHSYGPGRYMVSLHAEVLADKNIMDLHELIDQIERDLAQELNIVVTIHMDPINKDSEENLIIKKDLEDIIKDFKEIYSYHDFRIVGKEHIKNILFDVVVKPGTSKETEEQLRQIISNRLQKKYPSFSCIITFDTAYYELL